MPSIQAAICGFSILGYVTPNQSSFIVENNGVYWHKGCYVFNILLQIPHYLPENTIGMTNFSAKTEATQPSLMDQCFIYQRSLSLFLSPAGCLVKFEGIGLFKPNAVK
ncbi:MAG: hypothetical protein AB2699_20955 [Candidatus Thiodiazotropha taylori]